MKYEPTLYQWWQEIAPPILSRGVVACMRTERWGVFTAEPAGQDTYSQRVFNTFDDAIHYARTGEVR